MKNELPDERMPVWQALSDLFLDTTLQLADYDRIARELAATPYTLREIEDILYYEVYPACSWNVVIIGGEWCGFHPDWITENIAPRKNRRPWYIPATLRRWMLCTEWRRVKVRFQALRGE